MHTGSIPVGPTITAAAQHSERTMRQPNPLDPLDGVKRWLDSLWPIERVSVYLLTAAAVILLMAYVTR